MIHILKSATQYKIYDDTNQTTSFSSKTIDLSARLGALDPSLHVTNTTELLKLLTRFKLIVSAPTLDALPILYPELFI